jgi:hypothetical protein
MRVRITQKALLFHKVAFDFGDKALTYTIEDERNRVGLSVLYEAIEGEKSLQNYREKLPVYLGLLLDAAALLALVMLQGVYSPLVWIFAVLGTACLIVGRYTRFDATVMTTPLGKILVFDREHKQEIIDEIDRRRRAEIRRKYGEIDFLNDPKTEIGKYRWLKAQKIISEQEFNDAIAKISAAQRPATAQS